MIFLISLILLIVISIAWGSGLHKMKENYPEYKGDDFLDWDNNHTENEF